jgi:hypothetical protein
LFFAHFLGALVLGTHSLTLFTLQTLVTILSSLTFNRLIGHHQPGDLGDQVIESVETANVVMTLTGELAMFAHFQMYIYNFLTIFTTANSF